MRRSGACGSAEAVEHPFHWPFHDRIRFPELRLRLSYLRDSSLSVLGKRGYISYGMVHRILAYRACRGSRRTYAPPFLSKQAGRCTPLVHGCAHCSDVCYTLLAVRENSWVRSIVFRHPGNSVCNRCSVHCGNGDLKGMFLSKHATALGVTKGTPLA